jgi:hypothetical protein
MSRRDRRWPDPSCALILRPSKHPVGHRDGTTGFATVSKAAVMGPLSVARSGLPGDGFAHDIDREGGTRSWLKWLTV